MFKNNDLKRDEADMLHQFSEIVTPIIANLKFQWLSDESHLGTRNLSLLKKGS